MNTFKTIPISLIAGCVIAFVVSTRNVDFIGEVDPPEATSETILKIREQEIIEIRSDLAPTTAVTHKHITRKYASMDHILLGDAPQIDSRASHRITQNRMLTVVDLKSDLNVRSRVTQMRSLSALSSDEQETLYAAMLQDELPEGISRPSWNWMVDVMMTTLRTQGADISTMVERFSELARTERVDYTVRDYALQHLGHLKGEGADRETVDPILSDALGITDATVAGTALLALDNGLQSGELTEEVRIPRASQAAAIASDTSYSLESRVTALQVAARHDPSSVAQLAQQIVAQDDAAEILKLSAQAALRKMTN